jgi:hypothetical protein
LRLRRLVRTIEGVTEEVVPRDELEAAIEARKELGAEMEPAVIDAFVERIERRLAERGSESERSLKQKREHQKEMVLGAMGISVPLFALAAIFTGIAGVLAVCAALAVIAITASR